MDHSVETFANFPVFWFQVGNREPFFHLVPSSTGYSTSQKQLGKMEEETNIFQMPTDFVERKNAPACPQPLPLSTEHKTQYYGSAPSWGLQSIGQSSQIPALCIQENKKH